MLNNQTQESYLIERLEKFLADLKRETTQPPHSQKIKESWISVADFLTEWACFEKSIIYRLIHDGFPSDYWAYKGRARGRGAVLFFDPKALFAYLQTRHTKFSTTRKNLQNLRKYNQRLDTIMKESESNYAFN